MNDQNELVTKGFLRETLRETIREAIDELAMLINKGFLGMESRMAKQEDLLALTARVEGLEKDVHGFHGNFDIIFGELRAIRNQLEAVDSRAEVVDLQIRMDKVERKIKLNKA